MISLKSFQGKNKRKHLSTIDLITLLSIFRLMPALSLHCVTYGHWRWGVTGVDRVFILSLLMMDDELLGQIEYTSNNLQLCTLHTLQTANSTVFQFFNWLQFNSIQLFSAQPRKHFAFATSTVTFFTRNVCSLATELFSFRCRYNPTVLDVTRAD